MAGIGELLRDIGLMGVSGAVISLLLVVGRRIVMVLFNWDDSDKLRGEGREELLKRMREATLAAEGEVELLPDGTIRVVPEEEEQEEETAHGTALDAVNGNCC